MSEVHYEIVLEMINNVRSCPNTECKCGTCRESLSIAERSLDSLKEKLQKEDHELDTALKFLEEGKKKFSPNTTNSFVDDFLEKHKERIQRNNT